MKRRGFVALPLGSVAGLVRAQGGPVEGRHYVRVLPPVPTHLPAGKKVEVVEFFWYECPHCFAFEPALQAWAVRLPPDVAFRRVPVGFSARHQVTQKLFYALENLGQLERLHSRIFEAIHVRHQRLLSEAELVAFAAVNGIDGTRFSEMFNSFQVAAQASQARQLSDAYKIDGVPAMGVNGRWATSGAMAGTNERSLAVAEFLIERSR